MEMVSGFIVGKREDYMDILTTESIVVGSYGVYPIDRMVQIDEKLYAHVDELLNDRAIYKGERATAPITVLGNEFFLTKKDAIEHVIGLLALDVVVLLKQAEKTEESIQKWKAKLDE